MESFYRSASRASQTPSGDQQARVALAAAAAGSWQWDLRSMELTWSAQSHRLYGCSGSEAPTFEEWRLCIHPEDRALVEMAVRRVVEGRLAEYRCEFRVMNPSGGVRWLMELGRLTCDDSGSPVCLAGIALDITTRKDAEEAAAVANALKDEFIITLSHELRNAVAPILSAASVLGREPNERQRDSAQHAVLTNARHLRALLDDLNDPSGLGFGKLAVELQPVDLHLPLRQALEQTAAAIQDRGHRLRLELSDGELLVSADPTRLVQVFSNLIWNAVKYTPFGGEIVVRAFPENICNAVVEVQDNGIGIESRDCDRVFDMFVRARAGDGDAPGLGIGLALVRRLVELHSGHVALVSAGRGEGSLFSVTLPRILHPTLRSPS